MLAAIPVDGTQPTMLTQQLAVLRCDQCAIGTEPTSSCAHLTYNPSTGELEFAGECYFDAVMRG